MRLMHVGSVTSWHTSQLAAGNKTSWALSLLAAIMSEDQATTSVHAEDEARTLLGSGDKRLPFTAEQLAWIDRMVDAHATALAAASPVPKETPTTTPAPVPRGEHKGNGLYGVKDWPRRRRRCWPRSGGPTAHEPTGMTG